jgi:hypothetical protein
MLIENKLVTKSASISMGYKLDAWGLIPRKGKRFSLLHHVQTSSRAHPASYSGYQGLTPLGLSSWGVSRSKVGEVYLYSPMSLWCGAQLINTGTLLPLLYFIQESLHGI